MKKWKGIIIGLLISVFLVGCSSENVEVVVKEKPVKVEVLEEKTYPEELYYFGNVQPKSIKQLSFTAGGTLSSVYVEAGDPVGEGELLASLDPENYTIAVDTSAQQVRTAELDYGKSKEAFDYYSELYSDTKALYEAGATSKATLDEVELGYEVAKRELSQAGSVLNQARMKSTLDENLLSDTELLAPSEGYVVDVFSKEGEVVGQGYPVVLLRDKEQYVQIGVTSKDVKKIKMGMPASIIIDGLVYEGTVSKIHAMPDQTTRTYTIEVDIETDDVLLLGDMAKVYIKVSELQGIWLNVSDILNDGEDFIYVVEDKRAIRKNIEICEIYKEFVRVKGIESGSQLITVGSHSVKDGYQVTIVGDGHE